MAGRKTRDELFDARNVLTLCAEHSHDAKDLDGAMIEAEKSIRVGLFVLTGVIGDRADDREALELARQAIWAAERTVRHATGLYWEQRGARRRRKNSAGARGNVVALAPREAK